MICKWVCILTEVTEVVVCACACACVHAHFVWHTSPCT